MTHKNQKSDSVHVQLINFIRWLAQQIQPLKLKKFRYLFGLLLILNLVLKIVQEPFFCTLLYYLFFTTMFFSYFDKLFENQVLFQLRQEKDTSRRLSTLLQMEESANIEKIKSLTEAKEEIQVNAQKSAKIFQDQLKIAKLELKNAKKNYQEQARRQGIYSVIYLTKMKQQIKQLQQQLSTLTGKQIVLTGNSTQASNQRQKKDIISTIIQKFQKLSNYYQSQFKSFKGENNSSMKLSQGMNPISSNLNKEVWQRAMTGMSKDEQIQKIMDYQINTLKSIMLALLRERKDSAKMILNYENSLVKIKNILNNNFRSFTNSDSYDIQNNQDKVQGITKRIIHLFQALNLYKQSLRNAEQIMNSKDQQIQNIAQTQINNYQQMIYKLGNQNEQMRIGYEQIIKKFQIQLQRLNKQKETEKEKEKVKEKGREKEKEKEKQKQKAKGREKGEGKETTVVTNPILTKNFQINKKDPTNLIKTNNVNKKYIANQEITESENQ